MRKLRRIGVFGHYGNKNLGDEAIIQAVIQNIRQRLPDVVVEGFSINPQDTAARYGVAAYPIRRPATANSPSGNSATASPTRSSIVEKIKTMPLLGLAWKVLRRARALLTGLVEEAAFLYRNFRRLRTIDLLMITGSNQFVDNFGGPWGFPYTLLKWSVIARAAGTRVYFVSVGAGPISQPLSKTFIRWALKFSDHVSLRDAGSARLLREIGCTAATQVYPDLAHSLQFDHVSAANLPFVLDGRRLPVVGINPMPLYDSRYWCEADQGKYAAYVGKLVEFSSRLLDCNYPLFFFATQEKDNYVIEDILKELEARRQVAMPFDEYVLTSSTVDDLMANIAAADITVATRFHGTVLSLLSEKPMLGICYYRKAKELLQEMGQQNYAVELDAFTSADLWARFELLVANRVQEQAKIRAKKSEYIEALGQLYGSLLTNQRS